MRRDDQWQMNSARIWADELRRGRILARHWSLAAIQSALVIPSRANSAESKGDNGATIHGVVRGGKENGLLQRTSKTTASRSFHTRRINTTGIQHRPARSRKNVASVTRSNSAAFRRC